jgi:hypothetical protein
MTRIDDAGMNALVRGTREDVTEEEVRRELASLTPESLLMIAHERARSREHRKRAMRRLRARASAAARYVRIADDPNVAADVKAAAQDQYEKDMLAAELIMTTKDTKRE